MKQVSILAAAHGASAFGSAMSTVTVVLLLQRDSEAAVSIAVALGLLPSVIVGPLAAPLLDRVDIRRLLVITLIGRAVLVIALTTTTTAPAILALLAAGSTFSALDSPALTLLSRRASPPGFSAIAAYGRMDLGRGLGSLLGPAAAGLGTSAFGTSATLFVDAGTYLLLAATVVALSIDGGRRGGADPAQSWLSSALQGPRIIAGDHVLTAGMASLAAAIVFTSLLTVALVFFVDDTLHAGPPVYGLLVSVMAGGRLVAVWLAPRLRSAPSNLLIGAGVLMSLGLLSTGLAASSVIAVIGLFAVGVANAIQMLAIRALVDLRIPDGARGRALALVFASNNGATLVGTTAAAPLVGLAGAAAIMTLAGAGTLVTTLAAIPRLLRR